MGKCRSNELSEKTRKSIIYYLVIKDELNQAALLKRLFICRGLGGMLSGNHASCTPSSKASPNLLEIQSYPLLAILISNRATREYQPSFDNP